MELVEVKLPTEQEQNSLKKRGTNWTPEEEILLIEEVLKYEETLFGKMKGSGVKGKHGKLKESTWKSIAETLNLSYKNDRDNDTVKKKFNNIKQRGKEKIDMLRRPKTGGGPAPSSLTASEDALMQAFEGRPQIYGLPDGIDTDATDEIDNGTASVCTSSAACTSSACTFSATCTSSAISESATPKTAATGHQVSSKKPKRKGIKDAYEEEDLENMKLDNKKIKLQIEKLIIEKQKLQAEKELIEIKKAFLVRQFEERYPNSIIYTSNSSLGNEL
ncbi:uncharacterized protein LOC134260296 [Saccostrea cucullata]|uniref:uncharacterized protein LOC134260296 n=1 Tax=Saccostrea cuccullata TaxID=36930 RepID=UPI002ED3B6E3